MTQAANLGALGTNAGTTGILPAAGGGTGTASGVTGFKNRIINGAMVIDQRNAGASITPVSGTYTLDRWGMDCTVASKLSFQQNAGSVTPPVGFSKYLGITSLSAYSVSSSDFFYLFQNIEGFNTADLSWGTAQAKTVTLSFQVYSSLTGTFGGSLSNSAFNRSYPFTYSIPTANTWTTISVTIPGDTTGTWIGATNGIGIRVSFGLGVGSTNSGTAGAWAGSVFVSATGATSVVGTNGATWYLTGCQLEVGSTATNFDVRSYGTELALCQRYFQGSGASAGNITVTVGQAFSSSTAVGQYVMPVVMRATPSLTIPAGGTFVFVNFNGNGVGGTVVIAGSTNNQIVNFEVTGASGLTAGNASSLVCSYHGFRLSAEL
jgi:hypothetical protein